MYSNRHIPIRKCSLAFLFTDFLTRLLSLDAQIGRRRRNIGSRELSGVPFSEISVRQ